MNMFAIAINVENFNNANTAAKYLSKKMFSNGKPMQYLKTNTRTMYDLDSIAGVLGLTEFPAGFGKNGLEEFFSGRWSSVDRRWAFEKFAEVAVPASLLEEIMEFINFNDRYIGWTETVIVNTHGR